MESLVFSRLSSETKSTRTVPLTDGGMDGCGVPRPTTMTRIRCGGSVRVSFPFIIPHSVKRHTRQMWHTATIYNLKLNLNSDCLQLNI